MDSRIKKFIEENQINKNRYFKITDKRTDEQYYPLFGGEPKLNRKPGHRDWETVSFDNLETSVEVCFPSFLLDDLKVENIVDPIINKNREFLERELVGSQIVSVEKNVDDETILILSGGKKVSLTSGQDCCAETKIVDMFLHNVDNVDHVVTAVNFGCDELLEDSDGYHETVLYVVADHKHLLDLTLNWSAGNEYYYGYGLNISIKNVGDETWSRVFNNFSDGKLLLD